jgi:calcineurin-like phosphoesterase family protein
MNDSIVESINSRVTEDDFLIHLGDWSFGGFESIREFRSRINCKNIILILGNHDHHIERNKDNIQSIFSSVNEYLSLDVRWRPNHSKLVADSYARFVLFHYPIASWNGMSDGVIHLHGHVHLSPHQRVANGKAMDVGVDGNNMEPISMDEVLKIMSKQPVAKLTLPKDHHEKRV